MARLVGATHWVARPCLGPPSAPRVIDAHARRIAINAGEDGSVIVNKIQDNDTYAFGFDAQTGKFENLVSKGIIDPTKVVRTALQDAASIAGLLITTEAMVVFAVGNGTQRVAVTAAAATVHSTLVLSRHHRRPARRISASKR